MSFGYTVRWNPSTVSETSWVIFPSSEKDAALKEFDSRVASGKHLWVQLCEDIPPAGPNYKVLKRWGRVFTNRP